MPKVRRGGYVFLLWKGDHSPRYVHVYRNGVEVLKWDLEAGLSMKGQPSRRVLKLIDRLGSEGLL
jgi:hypothetical protein